MLAARASKTDIRPSLSCPKPLLQCEAKFEAIDVEMIFILIQLKPILTRKGFAASLAFKVRVLELGNVLVY